MTEPRGLILGFDPGGEGNSQGRFGWCICSTGNGVLQPPLAKGLAKNAWDALLSIRNALKRHYPTGHPPVLAAGIDAPLFWNPQGKRSVDSYLKKVLTPSGMDKSIMHINSLPGACLAQGLLLGRHLRATWNLPMTEAHPTVLLHLLSRWEQSKLTQMVEHAIEGLADHKRDATLSAVAAWAMIHQPTGWSDLFLRESCPVQLLDPPISYWMPLPSDGIPPQLEPSI